MSVKELFDGVLFQYEEEGAPSEELQGVLAYSGTGRLYIATDDGKIRSADVRQQLVSGEWSQDGSGSTQQQQQQQQQQGQAGLTSRTIFPSPPLELNTTHFVLNRSGTYAALAGTSAEDPEISGVGVVDLSSARPSREGDHDIAAAVHLDPTLFEARAGLRVLQASWHPDSDCHLALLTSDATWRLYNTQRTDLPEQTFELQLRGRRRLGLDSESAGHLPVAFAFGCGEGWDRFSVYFCTAAGQLFTLTPVVPFGCRYPARLVEGLRQSADLAAAGDDLAHAPTSLAWLGRAFQPAPASLSGLGNGSPAGGLLFSVPHALEEHVPALAGPLPVESAGGGSVSLTSLAGRRDAVQALHLARYGQNCTALAVATAAGSVGLHVVAGEGACPCWAESKPQCISEGVQLQAVRSQVPTAPAPQASPSLLLLDVVSLALQNAAQHAQQGAAGASGALVVDDYEDEYGEGPWGPAGRSMALCADPAVAERLYCVHPAGAHAITVSWLPLLSDILGAGSEGPGAAAAPLPASLPAPAVEELVASKAGVVDGVAVGDALSGSALLVLEADGTPRCLRPRPPPTQEPDSAGAGGGTEKGSGTVSAGVAAVEKDIQAHCSRVYGDLLAGPSGAKLPPPPAGPGGAANSAGQRHLSTSIAALRSSHVEFAHQAHHDLMQRLGQVKGEMEHQAARQARLAELAAKCGQAGDSLDARLARVAQFQSNLSARLALLGELHWSLPRPPSEAERVLKQRELPEFEAASRQLEGDIRALHGRVAALQRMSRSMGQVVASQASLAVQVPPQQLRRMREALAQQEMRIEANLGLLARLEAAAAEHGQLA